MIGRRVTLMRLERGHTDSELAAILELSVEEYRLLETGAVRISARQLVEISRALDCPMESFFQDLDAVAPEADPQSAEPAETVRGQLALLSRIFTLITKDEEREYLIRLAAGFASQSDTQERQH